MPPERIKLCDRVYLNQIETDKFKTNFFSVDFLMPLQKETAALNALLPQVLKRGTESYPNQAKLSEALDTLYASHLSPSVTKIGEVQAVGFRSYPLDDAYALEDTDILGGVLAILKEVLFRPYRENGLLCRDYVEGEKKNLIDSIRAQINNKSSYAVRRCEEEMCRGETYAIPETGTVEEVQAITAESLTAHYETLLKNSRIEIYYIGRKKKTDIASLFADMFSALPEGREPALETNVIKTAGEVKEITEEQPVAQGKLSLGFRSAVSLREKDYAAFALFRELYGHCASSKLFLNVREKLSLCYYCTAIPEPHKGIMIVTSGIDVANKQKAQDEILHQLQECVEQHITEEELSGAKKALINAYHELTDDAGSVRTWYFSRQLAGRCDSPEEAAETVAALSVSDVSEAASRLSLDTIYFLKGTLTKQEEEDDA